MSVISRAMLAGALSCSLLGSGLASAGVAVHYVQPDRYSDMPFSARGRDEVLEGLRQHFVALGARLPAGTSLAVDVTDLDLAGRIARNGRLDGDTRILRGGADWPTMHLHYSLEANGQVVRAGDEDLANMNYLQRLNRYPDSDPLRYEKQMIDDWFAERILGH